MVAVGVGVCPAARADEVEFNRDIRPILSDNCYKCHGPDADERQADLRLDTEEGARAELDDGFAIAPGKPDESEVYRRITARSKRRRMPPPDSGKTLTETQIDLVRRWIEGGARWQRHWSFLPPVRPLVPQVGGKAWVRTPIDAFILRRLEERGISPSPEADRYTLIRRLSLDLLGLLPAPEEVDAFVADDEPEAYERLVDRLLESKHHGERWGQHWLDQARYADSNGYSHDNPRIMWTYRDWVIQAINDDMPFDRFTIEQLAGDLLPAPTRSQLVATGFHRNTLINQEGGTDSEQFRVEAVVDRVNTTGAVWLGLTLGCAQCHSHKFDPITQKEYFQLFAFLNSSEDNNGAAPTIDVPLPGHERVVEELRQAREELAEHEKGLDARQAAWERRLAEEATEGVEWSPVEILQATSSGEASFQKLEDHSLLVGGDLADNEAYTLELRVRVPRLTALRLDVLPHPSLPAHGPGLAANGNFVLTTFEVASGGRPVPLGEARASHSQPDYPIGAAIDDDRRTGWAINVPAGSKSRMNVQRTAYFTLAEPLETNGAPLTVKLEHALNRRYLIGRFALAATGSAAAPAGAARPPDLLAALKSPPDERDDAARKLLREAYLVTDGAYQELKAAVARLEKERKAKTAPAMVMRDLDRPRPTHVHIRGDFLRKGEEVAPDVPAVLPPLGASERPTRLDLARWLVDPAHPLTARVTVNRIWMRYFGRGLVETENDFGAQGSLPTHPELLDWLATEFVERGWSLKAMHKLIVTSATYRQSSRARPDLVDIDPGNRLLARQARLRVEAEIVRDLALSASGLLGSRIGGPSVYPPQPDGVYRFTQVEHKWRTSRGEDRYRRGMYTFFFRNTPHPMLATFDSPDFNTTCTRRSRSNTPLQSLTMANSVALFEIAQGFAKRLLREVPDDDRRRLERGFRSCFSRPPAVHEIETLMSFLEQQTASFEAAPEAAAAVAPEDLPPGASDAVAAAWVATARVFLNTDEFITRE